MFENASLVGSYFLFCYNLPTASIVKVKKLPRWVWLSNEVCAYVCMCVWEHGSIQIWIDVSSIISKMYTVYYTQYIYGKYKMKIKFDFQRRATERNKRKNWSILCAPSSAPAEFHCTHGYNSIGSSTLKIWLYGRIKCLQR